MNETGMLNFVKALADADRLRIIGVLVQKSASLTEISQDLGFHPSDTRHYLDQLLQSGMIRLTEGVYALDSAALDKLARRHHEGKYGAYIPEADLEKDERHILVAYLKPDGTLRQIPQQPAKRQVNLILAHFHPDTAALRRALVDAGMLSRERDGSRYWRPA
jgi:hypothetical protein